MVTPAIATLPGRGDTLSDLRSRISGEVLVPGDTGYDQARAAWNLSFDQHPAIIVVPANPADVAAAVRYANAVDLPIAVQATGHGVAGLANEALLINLANLTGVVIDPVSRTAWIEGGAKWGAVLAKAQAFGLAPLLGSSPDVGAVGYTLGGGLGWLARKYGLAADRVRSFQIVTADGHCVRACETENPDLFWALKGGGGAFGIVVSMEIELVPVSRVYGGNLIYPAADAAVIYRRYRDWIRTVPAELTSSVSITNFPPIPEVPEPLRGQTVVMIRGCYAGSPAAGAELLRFWRDWKAPLIDEFTAMPFSEVAAISNDPVDPVPALSTGAWLRDLSDDVIDVLVEATIARQGPPLLMFNEVRHIGGAVSDPRSASYGHRDETLLLQLVGFTPSPEVFRQVERYTAEVRRAIASRIAGAYPNFLEGSERQARTPEAYSAEQFRRLQTVKAKFDPDNRFRFGFGISPNA